MSDADDQYPARFYCALHTGTAGDVEVYQRYCQGALSILELGCGDGRILAELSGKGRSLFGLDTSETMLQLARARFEARGESANLLRADMMTFDLEERFDRILLPFNGLFCLLGQEQKERCIERVVGHLQPLGWFLLDVYDAQVLDESLADTEPEPEVDSPEFIAELSLDGVEYRVFEQNLWWPSKRQLVARYEYRTKRRAPTRGSAPASVASNVTGSILHSYCHPAEILDLLRAAGLEPSVHVLPSCDEDAADQLFIAARLVRAPYSESAKA